VRSIGDLPYLDIFAIVEKDTSEDQEQINDSHVIIDYIIKAPSVSEQD
jgi:hypothetical protein